MLTPKEAYWWVRGWIRKESACGTKQRLTLKAARKAKVAMEKKTGRKFDIYPCLFCRKFHIGGSVKKRKEMV